MTFLDVQSWAMIENRKHTSLLISWECPESAITASIFELQNN
jgi:hypothetical protein